MKTLIFDLDGTLVDTSTDISVSINFIRSEIYGLPPLTTKKIVELMNLPGLNLAYEFYGVQHYENRTRELFEEHYSTQCLKSAECFEGIPELLNVLKNGGVEMFVATNAPTKTSEIILQNNGIEKFFTEVVGADRVSNAKPHPQMVEMLTNGRNKNFCWMAGDSMKDIMAARDAGITPIFVQWGFAAGEIPDLEVEKRAEVPAEIIEILGI